MFGVDSTELLVIALVAMVVIGPKDLPRVMRAIGKWVGKARGMANQFKVGVNDMVRDSEIADLEKKWREQNDAIMRASPFGKPEDGKPDGAKPESDWGLPPASAAEPLPAPAPEGTRRAPAAPAGMGHGPVTRARDVAVSQVSPPEQLPPEPVAVPAVLPTPPRSTMSVAPARPAPRAPAAS